jgi:hypothetical protein
MEPNAYKLLNQLVAAALTVFIAVIVLVAALVIRHMWLQQHIVELSSGLQENMDELAVITEEIQSGLAESQTAVANPQQAERGGEITGLVDNLENLDKQLSSIEEDLNQVALVLESGRIQYQVNQVFTVIAAFVAIASVAVAILLGMAMRVQEDITNRHSHH